MGGQGGPTGEGTLRQKLRGAVAGGSLRSVGGDGTQPTVGGKERRHRRVKKGRWTRRARRPGCPGPQPGGVWLHSQRLGEPGGRQAGSSFPSRRAPCEEEAGRGQRGLQGDGARLLLLLRLDSLAALGQAVEVGPQDLPRGWTWPPGV